MVLFSRYYTGAVLMLVNRRTDANILIPVPDHPLLDQRSIRHNIFHYCSPATLVNLSIVSRSTRTAVKMYYAEAFNINASLQRFFPDPTSFRSLQAVTGTLIAGSFALQFFDRAFYPESDLDLYVPYEQALKVALWLMHVGYSFKPSAFQPRDFLVAIEQLRPTPMTFYSGYGDMRGIAAVFTFDAPSRQGSILKVQCIVTLHASMEAILSFHSSTSTRFSTVICA